MRLETLTLLFLGACAAYPPKPTPYAGPTPDTASDDRAFDKRALAAEIPLSEIKSLLENDPARAVKLCTEAQIIRYFEHRKMAEATFLATRWVPITSHSLRSVVSFPQAMNEDETLEAIALLSRECAAATGSKCQIGDVQLFNLVRRDWVRAMRLLLASAIVPPAAFNQISDSEGISPLNGAKSAEMQDLLVRNGARARTPEEIAQHLADREARRKRDEVEEREEARAKAEKEAAAEAQERADAAKRNESAYGPSGPPTSEFWKPRPVGEAGNAPTGSVRPLPPTRTGGGQSPTGSTGDARRAESVPRSESGAGSGSGAGRPPAGEIARASEVEQERKRREAAAQRERDDYLSAMRSGIRLKAFRCDKDMHVIGSKPSLKSAISCIDVDYRVSCPGVVTAASGSMHAYIGGSSCYAGDAQRISPQPSCPIEQATVTVTDVRPCK